MFGLGWQELLILAIVAVPIIVIILVAKRGKIVSVAAGLGLLQGLANIGFALFGAPAGYIPQGEPDASVAITLMLVQGPALIVFAVATYRRKLWGAYGLLIMALLSALLLLLENVKSGWLIPILVTLIYVLAVRSLHRPRATPQATSSS